MRAVGYVRVSTEDQASSGLGIEAQRAAIAAAAKRLELELAGVHADEGVSGSVPPLERPGLSRALEDLAAGDTLLVAKRDRLGRSSLENGLLEQALAKRKVRIVSAAGEGTERDDPYSRFLRRIMDAVAELERDLAIARTRDALKAKRARGERAGAVPFGFRLVGDKLERDLEEQETLAIAVQMRAKGAGFAAIARELERLGRAPRGSRWWRGTVRSILDTEARSR